MSEPAKFYLFKRRNGLWYIIYVHEGCKRWKSTKATKKTDALKALANFRELFRAKVLNKSLNTFSTEYLEHSKGVHSPTTTICYSFAFKQFIKIVGDIPIHRVGVREVEKFLRTKKEEASEWTARKYYIALSSAFETAISWAYLPSNPFRLVEKPKTREIQPAYFTQEEFWQFLHTVDDVDFRDLCICAVSTGMRLSELASLQWTTVDLDAKVVHVRNSDIFTTKGRRNRSVAMSDEVLRILILRHERAGSELVFHLKGKRMSKDYISKKFKRYVRQACLNDKLHFHSLRHTFASWLVHRGVSLYEVQMLLGHSTISVTQVYSHLQPQKLHDTVNRIEWNEPNQGKTIGF